METAAETKSSGFSPGSLTASKSVPLTRERPCSSRMQGIQPSVKRKRGRPLSVCYRKRLIVKGFAFYEKCKKVRTVASSGVIDENDGNGAKACLSSETVMSPNKVRRHGRPRKRPFQESPGIGASDDMNTEVVQRRDLPQEILADESLFNNGNLSLARKCDHQEAHQNDSDDRVRMTKGYMKETYVVGFSVDENAVNARKRGRPRKIRVAGESLSDENKLFMRKHGSTGGRVKVAVVHRRGRPRKRPFAGTSVSRGMSVIRKHLLKENWDANAVVVRRRGRPRKIPMDDVSFADKNMSQATKCIHQQEHQDDDGKEDRETGRLLKADEVVRLSFDENTAVRKRGRPRKRPVHGASLTHGKTLVMTKYGLQEQSDAAANSAVVHRRGRPRKRSFTCASVSAEDVGVNRGMSVIRKENLNVNASVIRRRGQRRKIPVSDIVAENLSTQCILQQEHQDDNVKEAVKTDRLVKADEVVRTSFDANTAVRKRGRPRKRCEDNTSLNGLNRSFTCRRKRSRQEEDWGDNVNEAGVADGHDSI